MLLLPSSPRRPEIIRLTPVSALEWLWSGLMSTPAASTSGNQLFYAVATNQLGCLFLKQCFDAIAHMPQWKVRCWIHYAHY